MGRPRTTTLKILDDSGNELPVGETGNVYLQMHGSRFEYHQDEEKTAKTYVGELFTMGDIGYVDSDGYLFLCDRKNDMIISGGVNIYPAEIESEMTCHEAVRDVAVFGIPHKDWGEEVKAVIELAEGYTESDELKARSWPTSPGGWPSSSCRAPSTWWTRCPGRPTASWSSARSRTRIGAVQ